MKPLYLAVLFAVFFLAACSSVAVGDGLEKVRLGMDKDTVLRLADNPKHTFHTQGQDHWIYSYYSDDQEFLRDVVFENGLVVQVKPAHAKSADDDATGAASTPEQELQNYEQSVRQQQQQHQGEFKDIPGQ